MSPAGGAAGGADEEASGVVVDESSAGVATGTSWNWYEIYASGAAASA